MNISVIVPTIANSARKDSLFAAVQSLVDQAGGAILPIVVANGNRYDPNLLGALRRDRRIRFLYLKEGNLPRAIAAGRVLVDTEFFGVLDDDDLYLPNAATVRLAAFRDDPTADVVVTNGLVRTREGDKLLTDDMGRMASDPALELMRFQWLASCAGLYRTSTIGSEFFYDAPPFVEWTYVGLRAALTRKIKFVNSPTFVVDKTTPDSLSKSNENAIGELAAISHLMRLNPPRRVRRQLKRKYISALHELSRQAFSEQEFEKAWRYHLITLKSPQGLRYLSYTRHLIMRGVGGRKGVTVPS
jgi:hypothetical protein